MTQAKETSTDARDQNYAVWLVGRPCLKVSLFVWQNKISSSSSSSSGNGNLHRIE